MSKLTQIFKKRNSEDRKDFRDQILECNDEALIKILTQRTYYIPEAAQLAIDEAIRRGIISSEQDLLQDKYRVQELNFTWFPQPINNSNRTRIRKSVGRSLVICGIFPVVYGFIKLNAGNQIEGKLILGFGLLWIFLSSQLLRTFQKQFVFVLLAANIVWAVFVFVRLLSFNRSPFMDFFVAVVLFVLVLYGLIYLYKIGKTTKDVKI
ncbi:hypothetical protein [Maribellus mangrovi]|uniref:hypothetical protein n=1 Tax=Maribellus mangrovi TaxID=3133146 RepID=UPI0030ECDD40